MKNYVIVGKRFSVNPTYYRWDVAKEFPNYSVVEEYTFGDQPFESLEHAMYWLLQNHPDLYFGANIYSTDGSGDFAMIPVKGYHLFSGITYLRALQNELKRLEFVINKDEEGSK